MLRVGAGREFFANFEEEADVVAEEPLIAGLPTPHHLDGVGSAGRELPGMGDLESLTILGAALGMVAHELLEDDLFETGGAEFAPVLGGHISDEKLLERGAREKSLFELVEIEEERFFGFSGEENAVCELVAIFVVCHPGSSVQWGLTK